MATSVIKKINFRIFIVEDDDIDRLSIKRAWEKKDACETKFLMHGNELFDHLDSLNAQSLPDMIILDLNMPVMGGREILDKLKAHEVFKVIPVVIFTVSEKPSDIKYCYEKGCYSYIIKPNDTKELSEIVDQMWIFLFKVSLLPSPDNNEAEIKDDDVVFKIKPRVLVVEEESKAKIIVNNLLQLGYRTSIAADHESACKLIDQIKYNIILMDIKTAEMVREHFADKNIVIPPVVTLPSDHSVENKNDFADLINKYL